MLKLDTKNTGNSTFKPINPPFVFRDPNNPNQIFGSASSIRELAEILPYVPYFSIEHHMHRIEQDNSIHCDLAIWIRYILGFSDLADRVEKLAEEHNGLELKEHLINLINENILLE